MKIWKFKGYNFCKQLTIVVKVGKRSIKTHSIYKSFQDKKTTDFIPKFYIWPCLVDRITIYIHISKTLHIHQGWLWPGFVLESPIVSEGPTFLKVKRWWQTKWLEKLTLAPWDRGTKKSPIIIMIIHSFYNWIYIYNRL